MHVKLIAITDYLAEDSDTQDLLEHAGRVCYRSIGRGDSAATFLRARLHEGHESLIEHASATFEISGISRACSHQLVRHRIASYSQESQRFVEMNDPEIVVPPAIAAEPAARALWTDFINHVKTTYRGLRDLGILKEDARFVLPNATATRIVMTMNFRSYRHFFDLRISREAQWEIRQVAVQMLQKLALHAPAIFEDMLVDLQEQHPEFFQL